MQRCIDSVNQASTTLLEGPLWLKTEGKKWKKFHFILRDYNLFQTTKSKKGSVHDVHFVASLATVKVYNGIGWKKRYKAPTDFCFALKPPEVQEKKAHIRYLCAENEFVKWGWYSMLRLTLGPPQVLVDNYNAQLGVTPSPLLPEQQGHASSTGNGHSGISRSASITSNGDCSMSSGCVSEVDEENAFDVDYPDGGTIRRKPAPPTAMMTSGVIGDSLPLPPPPQINGGSKPGDITPTDASQHLPLPPPPTALLHPEEGQHDMEGMNGEAIREPIYPCGVMRTRYPPPPPELTGNGETGSQEDLTAAGITQLSLLQQLPNQAPPNLHALLTRGGEVVHPETISVLQQRPRRQRSPSLKRKITFSEFVYSLEDSQWEPLKGSEEEIPTERPTMTTSGPTPTTVSAQGPTEDQTSSSNSLKEQDVSNWVLRHCNGSAEAKAAEAAAAAMRPKLFNGRTVPNCFSPQEVEAQMRLQQSISPVPVMNNAALHPNVVNGGGVIPPNANLRQYPPAPPRRGVNEPSI